MDVTDREHLVTNIVPCRASDEVTPDMQQRVIAYWSDVDADLGARVAARLGHGKRGLRPRNALIRGGPMGLMVL